MISASSSWRVCQSQPGTSEPQKNSFIGSSFLAFLVVAEVERITQNAAKVLP
jgi:hypothetical protein